MTPISPVSTVNNLSATKPRPGAPSELQSTFQDTVGSLFFGQMMKALRSGVGKPAYLHGGQAEEMFQAQMDQQVAQDLAHQHAGGLVDDLFQRFLIDHPTGPTGASGPRVARHGVFDGHDASQETTPFAKPQGHATPTSPQTSAQLDSLSQAAKSTALAESAQQAACARPLNSGGGFTTGTGLIPALNRK